MFAALKVPQAYLFRGEGAEEDKTTLAQKDIRFARTIQRLQRSLREFVIEGITTTIDLHKKILNHKKFINSDFDVNWLVKENFY